MSKARIIIVGGGFSGVAAAIAANKVGAQATLLERTNMLGGAGLRGGLIRYNGAIVPAEETKAMGGQEVFEALESIVMHKGNIIDEEHTSNYNPFLLDTTLLKIVEAAGVELHLESRVVDVEKENGSLKAITTDSGERFPGDVFIDASGSLGGLSNCIRYGHGCVMCFYRCLIFGDRVSIATKAGAEELTFLRHGGLLGMVSPAVILFKESLSPELQARLKKEGAFSIPIPKELIDYARMEHFKGLRGPREVEHLNIVDNGIGAKCVGVGYFPLASYRKIPGFETAQFLDPMEGGSSNAILMLSFTPRDNSLRAKGFKNLFVTGEKSMIVGIDDVLSSGVLAGNNAARVALGQQPLELPRSICVGDLVAFAGERLETTEGRSQACFTGHGIYFERMKELGFYSPEPAVIHKRIDDMGLTDIFAQRLA